MEVVNTVDAQLKADFENWVHSGRPPVRESIGRLPLYAAALMTHAAFVEPERQIAIYDALSEAWLDKLTDKERVEVLCKRLPFLTDPLAIRDWRISQWRTPSAILDAFWESGFETGVRHEEEGPPMDALAYTTSVVAIGLHYDAELLLRCERALLLHEDVRRLLDVPERKMKTEDLRGLPSDSLGNELLEMLTANNFDLEVIDPDTVVLPDVFRAQNRTNRRILQLHDVLHLFAGYEFTSPGEIAISGFQLALFGQNYSARFLAVTTTFTAINWLEDHDQNDPNLFISLVCEGWRHGRCASPLLSAPWHDLIGKPISELRPLLNVEKFRSKFAEQLYFNPLI